MLIGHVELGADLPQRLVVVLPQRREVRVGRDRRQQDAAERARSARSAQRISATASSMSLANTWTMPARRPGAAGAEVGQPAVVRLHAGPAPLVVLRAWAAARPGCPPRRRAERCWGRGPRPRCRPTPSPPAGGRCPSCGRRWARAGRRRGSRTRRPRRRTRRASGWPGRAGSRGCRPRRGRRPRRRCSARARGRHGRSHQLSAAGGSRPFADGVGPAVQHGGGLRRARGR